MKRDTRRYAKRQITWLSGEPETVSLAGPDPLSAAQEEIRKFLF
jgi:tRNA A37 N6-isopentenylltransferase MiaA